MAEYGPDLLESGTLPQHLRGRRMSEYMRATERSVYSCPSDGPFYDCRHGADLEGSPRGQHTDEETSILNGWTSKA
jgi:hypothetical protein